VAGRAPVSVKMRAGWDASSKNAPELARLLVARGAGAIIVHGRTRQQRFDGAVDLELIARVKQAVSVPVIANGDVADAASMQRALEATCADGVMVGRAALGNPWVFGELRAWCEGRPLPPPPAAADRLAMYLRHLELYLEVADEWRAVVEMRKFARWYLAPVPGGEQLRRRINGLTEAGAIRALIEAAGQIR
jgi:tRNA-dihydrouridine synthase